MSQGRDDAGRFEQTVSEQEILKVFDYEDDPVLTASEVATGLKRFGIEITPEGIRNRLQVMQEAGLVSRKKNWEPEQSVGGRRWLQNSTRKRLPASNLDRTQIPGVNCSDRRRRFCCILTSRRRYNLFRMMLNPVFDRSWRMLADLRITISSH